MTSKTSLLLFLLLVVPTGLRADDAQSAKEARLRDALKAAYEQIRTVQEQNATLQAGQAESEKEKETLKTQVQTLTDQSKADATKNGIAMQAAKSQNEQLKIQAVMLQRKVEEDERRNLALYQLGNEILTRYEKFSLGDALAAKEPFTSLTRTKLENLVQGYQDKLIAQKLGTNPPPPVPAPADQKTADNQ